jgi:hypothetical protein
VYWPSKDSAIKHVFAVAEARTGTSTHQEESVRRVKWDELVTVMRALEGMHGWAPMDGREAYTKDKEESHKSRVLGTSRVTFNLTDRRRVQIFRQGRVQDLSGVYQF